MKLNVLVPAAIAATGLTLTAAPAEAALIATGLSCNSGGAMALMNPDALACSGAWAGNDANQQADVLAKITADFGSIVGLGDWSYTDKADSGQDTAYFDVVPGSSTGTLTLDNPLTGYFAIALKASNSFSVYLFDGGTTGISSIDYSTLGTSVNRRGVAQGLSHATLYSFNAPATSVPEPFTVLGLAAVAGVGLALKRSAIA